MGSHGEYLGFRVCGRLCGGGTTALFLFPLLEAVPLAAAAAPALPPQLLSDDVDGGSEVRASESLPAIVNWIF